MVSAARKQRGRRTEHVVAAYFAQFWERAVAVNSGASGSDILNTPFHIEVKARKDFSPLAWVKQNERRPDGTITYLGEPRPMHVDRIEICDVCNEPRAESDLIKTNIGTTSEQKLGIDDAIWECSQCHGVNKS